MNHNHNYNHTRLQEEGRAVTQQHQQPTSQSATYLPSPMAEEAGSAVADRGGDLERMVLGILDKGPVLGMEQLLARIREETTATSTKNKQASENSTTLKDCQEVSCWIAPSRFG